MDRHNILLDVGGTFIKCGDGRSIPIDSDGSEEAISASLREAVGESGPGDRVAVAIPGPFDYEEGLFLMKHKFAAVYGERFSDLAGIPDGASVRFIHDVNCMLLGEMDCGAAKDFRNVALVTLGTGLGFSMALDGTIMKAPSGSPAVSIYATPYRGGILEDYVSKRGILRGYQEISDEPATTVKEIAQRGMAGEPAAREVFRRTASILSEAIRDILYGHGVECLLFGGQISKAFPLMQETLEKGLPDLARISPVSDFDKATFNGLAAFLNG